jgi:hypothetical protein
VRLLQQARLIAARVVSRHFAVAGPLYDGGIRVERWPALAARATDRAGPFELEALIVLEQPPGSGPAALKVNGVQVDAPPGTLVAFRVTEHTHVEPPGGSSPCALIRLGLTRDVARADATAERIC